MGPLDTYLKPNFDITSSKAEQPLKFITYRLHVLIMFYLLLCLMQFIIALALYHQLFQWKLQNVAAFYLGSPSGLAESQSILRLLESLLPHILAMGTSCFILLHFMGFMTQLSAKFKTFSYQLLITSFLMKNCAGPLILWLGPSWSYLHMGGFVLFELVFLGISAVVFVSCAKKMTQIPLFSPS